MIIFIVIVTCLVTYAIGIGATQFIAERLLDFDGLDSWTIGIFWPFGLPAILTRLLLEKAADHFDAKREEAKKESEDLKRRIDELDKEIKTGR
jgi:hypothetical protein